MGVLIKCATCGDKVSSAAKACPHCGEPDFHGDALADHRVDAIALQSGQLSTHTVAMGERSSVEASLSAERLNDVVSNNGFPKDPESNGQAHNGTKSFPSADQSVDLSLDLPNKSAAPSSSVAVSFREEDERSPQASLAEESSIEHTSASDPSDVPTVPQPAETPEPVAIPAAVPSIPMLVYWASLGQVENIQNNITQFPDVNASDGSGYTALHAAAEYGYVEITQLLLDNGADCSVRYTPTGHTSSYAGFTPLMLAEKTGHRDVAALIRTKMEVDQAQRLAAAPRPRVQHSPIVKQAIADVAASARQSQPRVVGHNHALGPKHLDVTYVFDNRGDLQTARRNGKCEWLQFETRAALKKRGFPLQIYPTINIWFKDKTSFYMNEGRSEFR
jgi:ankyrin repeat protein